MPLFGAKIDYYEKVLFVAFAIIASFCFVAQIYFTKSLRLFSIYLLPILSLCICYVNVVSYYGDRVSSQSDAANCGYVLHSLIIPLFCLVEYEISYRLHEAKGTHFCCLRFDQGRNYTTVLQSQFLLWGMRLIVVGLFVINIIVNFDVVDNAIFGGYMTLAKHSNDLGVWLHLVPPTFLSILSLLLSLIMYRFGNNQTLSFGYNRRWRLLGPCTLAQFVGQIFNSSLYPVTSIAGELVLLIGVTNAVYLIQQELVLASWFVSYLHRSNEAFEPPPGTDVVLNPNVEQVASQDASAARAESSTPPRDIAYSEQPVSTPDTRTLFHSQDRSPEPSYSLV